jgi:hypothetical protein
VHLRVGFLSSNRVTFSSTFKQARVRDYKGIRGMKLIKNHMQVTCLEFRLKLTSQLDGGSKLEELKL